MWTSVFCFFGQIPMSTIVGLYGKSTFSKILPNSLPKWLCHFALAPSNEWEFLCSTFLLAFGVVTVLNFGYHVCVSHRCFNWYLPGDIWCGTFYHMLVCHLPIFFGEIPVKIFSPFFLAGVYVNSLYAQNFRNENYPNNAIAVWFFIL